MPWTTDRYPPSMRHLTPAARVKAIEIANALLREGMDEGRAIRIGIAQGKAWAARHEGQWATWRLEPFADSSATGWHHGGRH